MITLLIETATEKGAVFIFKNEQLIFSEYLPPGLHNSTDLLPVLQKGIAELGISSKEIGLIGVSAGPGSYTGMRVGAMAAKALSYALKIPLVGVPTLACFSPKSEGAFVVAIDAKVGGVYLQKAYYSNSSTSRSETVLCALEEIGNILPHSHCLRVLTPSSKQFECKLEPFLKKICAHYEWEEAAPNPYAMYEETIKLYKSNTFAVNGFLELNYMRKTQAEIEKGK